MKRKLQIITLCILLVPGSWTFAQNSSEVLKEDTATVNSLIKLGKTKLATAPDSTILLAQQAVDISEKIDFQKGKALALKNIGLGYFYQSKYLEALNYWTESLKVFESLNDQNGIANLLNNIASVYSQNDDSEKALEYSLRSLKISEKLGDKLRILSALSTVATVYYNNPATIDTALNYYLRALPLSEEIGDMGSYGVLSENIGEIYSKKAEDAKDRGDNAKSTEYDTKSLEYYNKAIKALGNTANSPFAYNGIAKLYLKKGNTEDALKYHDLAISIAEKTNGKSHIMQAYRGIANVYVKKNDIPNAISYFKKSEELALELNSKTARRDIYGDLSIMYQTIGDFKNAYAYQDNLINIKDSILNDNTQKKLGALKLGFELEKKQDEITILTKDKDLQIVQTKRQKFAKNAFMIGLFLAFIIAALIFRDYRIKVKMHKLVDKQKNEIERLLLNVLPKEVAKELQLTGRATPKHYKSVAVMFTDFRGFTLLTDHMSPDELVAELDACFNIFDEIIAKHNLEKIKTIGDSYMCAGGIPKEDEMYVLKIVRAGLEIQQYIATNNERRLEKGLEPWYLRIGIHVGPVVAGVVGKMKYAYDIWGSTVNIASRMESNGEPGKVNISASTYELIKDYYECSYRGKISAKNVGEIDMYFIEHEYTIPKSLLLNEHLEIKQ